MSPARRSACRSRAWRRHRPRPSKNSALALLAGPVPHFGRDLRVLVNTVRSASAIIAALLLVTPAGIATAGDHPAPFVEPKLYIAKGGAAAPQVALTLDACSGQTDLRILNTLVENRIPATIFVTARWMRHNAEALAVMQAHPDLFELENHGFNHIPAIDNQPTMFGLKTAGSEAAIRSEIQGGVD
eukprot:gene29846-36730_t